MSNYSPMPAFFIVELFPLKTVNNRLDLCGISVCLRLAGAFAKFQTAPLHRRHTPKQ